MVAQFTRTSLLLQGENFKYIFNKLASSQLNHLDNTKNIY